LGFEYAGRLVPVAAEINPLAFGHQRPSPALSKYGQHVFPRKTKKERLHAGEEKQDDDQRRDGRGTLSL
jgi:hypothetical protein